MSARLRELAARRTRLQLRCAAQRDKFESLIVQIEAPVQRLDRALLWLQGFAKKPAVVLGAIATVFAVGPRRLIRGFGRALFWTSAIRRLINR